MWEIGSNRVGNGFGHNAVCPGHEGLVGSPSWLIADPDAFGEVMTNVLEVVGLTGAKPAA
jgi:hypothetical protein